MLFNSREFIVGFLPITLVGFYLLVHGGLYRGAKIWLLVASLFVYFCWDPVCWPILLLSVGVNFVLTEKLRGLAGSARRTLFLVGLLFNILLLGVFKYTNFFLGNLDALGVLNWVDLHIALPLGISFYTFVQIAFLIDVYEGLSQKSGFLDYSLMVLFFPKLVSGPIVHQSDVLPQLASKQNARFNYENLTAGMLLFAIGLAKKVALADNLSIWASSGFSLATPLNLLQAWITSISFTLSVYFDFSGYTDMALGLGLMFNIALPNNFNSPFKATCIIDFWQRWHMTLTRFLTTYVFSAILRAFQKVTFRNFVLATFATMLISGFWHGASWLFICFGMFHGLALVINHIWRKRKLPMPPLLGWLLTFNLVNFSNVFFRAGSFDEALRVVRGMLGLSGVILPKELLSYFPFLERIGQWLPFGDVLSSAGNGVVTLVLLGLLLALCLLASSSVQLVAQMRRRFVLSVAVMLVVFYSIVLFGKLDNASYVYFQF